MLTMAAADVETIDAQGALEAFVRSIGRVDRLAVDLEADAKHFHVTPNGVVLVTPEMLGQVLHYVR